MKKIIVALVLIVLFGFVFINISSRVNIKEKVLVIHSKQSFLSITEELSNQGIIKNKYFFKIYVFLNGSHKDFKPGDYFFNGNYSMRDILNILTTNKGIPVTIPEGLNIYQIEYLLLKNEIIKQKGDLVNYTIGKISFDLKEYPFLENIDSDTNLEGFLYPNTYFFVKNVPIESIIKVFLDNFNENIYLKSKNDISLDNFYNHLIKVSLLEKEIYHKEDIPMALSVINNRLDSDMRLQIDATLCYPKFMLQYEKDQDLSCNKIVNSDKLINSSYNTYKYNGLTRTPISNVNWETFKMTLNPIESDYFYYINIPANKDTIFAKTLDEHNRNIGKYLR